MDDKSIDRFNMKRESVKFAEEYSGGKLKIVAVATGALLGLGNLNFAASSSAGRKRSTLTHMCTVEKDWI